MIFYSDQHTNMHVVDIWRQLCIRNDWTNGGYGATHAIYLSSQYKFCWAGRLDFSDSPNKSISKLTASLNRSGRDPHSRLDRLSIGNWSSARIAGPGSARDNRFLKSDNDRLLRYFPNLIMNGPKFTHVFLLKFIDIFSID